MMSNLTAMIEDNSTSNASNDPTSRTGTSLYSIPLTTKTVMTSAYTIAFILGLLGNGLGLFIVIKRSRKSFCSTNVLIGNMALADLLVTVFAMPQSVGFLYIQNKWFGGIAGNMACKLAHFPYVVTIAASILTILCISIERYCAVFYLLRNSIFRRSKFLTALIWGFSLALASPYLFSYTVTQDTNGQHYCVVEWGDIETTYQSQRIYYLFIFIFLYALPLIFISVLYTLIARKLWRKTTPRDGTIATRKSAVTQKRKVIRLLIVLVIVFAACAAPAHIMHYYMFYDQANWMVIPIEIKLISFWISQSNSTINPAIYILLNESFRREFFRLTQSAMCLQNSAFRVSSTKTTKRTWKMKRTMSTRYWMPGKKREACL
ncbi:QRFP-like peptide receptor [Actinia tenebrosa]|uniref:QRFP-like peptide receptor n=1 Tax=Actinia tenebrosa TaxID=6105 RepID=A0A6P8IPJ1_ACTTE|nr:QRFP-like peptide receptor [Actinia tenebrosa]